MTDEQIRELAEKHGFFGVDVWWQANTPRFRAMLEELADYKAEAMLSRRYIEYLSFNLRWGMDTNLLEGWENKYLAARVKDGE